MMLAVMQQMAALVAHAGYATGCHAEGLMSRLAFYTFVIGKGTWGSEVLSGTLAVLPSVLAKAERADGFIAEAQKAKPDPQRPGFGQVYGPWGLFAVPRFYDGGTAAGEITRASTLSLWRDIEAVRRFAYDELHKAALAERGAWFRQPEWPIYVMWWVADDETPTWDDACRRLELLHDEGPTPVAFSFKAPFDPSGHRVRLSTVAATDAVEQPLRGWFGTRKLLGRRILIVEDEALIAMLVEDTLFGAGAAVVGPVTTAAAALAILKHDPYLDAAVLDLSLAGETTEAIAAVLSQRGVPYLVAKGFSAGAFPDVEARAAGTLGKPYNPTEIIAKLVAICR